MIELNVFVLKSLRATRPLWVFAMAVVFLLSLSGCGTAAHAPEQTETAQCGVTTVPTTLPPTEAPTETTQWKVTLEDMRGPQITDVDAQDYDTVCYMLYYGLQTANDGLYNPQAITFVKEAASIVQKVTGLKINYPQPEEPLSRQLLAQVLYDTAVLLGYPTEITLDILPYPDMPQEDTDGYRALCWATEHGLFQSFVGTQLLPELPVSRLQLAQAFVAMQALNPEDEIAREIFQTQPIRDTASVSRENHDALQAQLNDIAENFGVIGMQVAVIEHGELTDHYAYGWATRGKTKMTEDHKIRVASVSKVGVGIFAQLLREEGIIDLDADISEYWGCKIGNPRYPDIPVTIRTMLTHTSSLRNSNGTGIDDIAHDYDSVKPRLQRTGYGSAQPGDFSHWQYNNFAFGALGMTLELAADKPINPVMQDRLFRYMDIDAAFGSANLENTKLLATLYHHNGQVARSIDELRKAYASKTPGKRGTVFAGGLTISGKDLGKLIALIAADGVYEGIRLMEEESIRLMETYSEEVVTLGSHQALPMRYWPNVYGTQGVFYHTGKGYGVLSCVCYDPITGNGVVILTVGSSGAKGDDGMVKIFTQIHELMFDTLQ